MTLGGKARIVGDPTGENIGQPVPVIPSAPGVLFARQAERLETLVVDHPMSDGRRFSQ